MAFKNSIPFSVDVAAIATASANAVDAIGIENKDFFLWRGINGVPSQLPVTLTNVTYGITDSRAAYVKDATAATIPTITFPSLGYISPRTGNLATTITVRTDVYKVSTPAGNTFQVTFGTSTNSPGWVWSETNQQFSLTGTGGGSTTGAVTTFTTGTWHTFIWTIVLSSSTTASSMTLTRDGITVVSWTAVIPISTPGALRISTNAAVGPSSGDSWANVKVTFS